MKAAILKKPYNLEIMDIPLPEPLEDEIRIKVKACGICGSDLRYYRGENPWAAHTLGVKRENPANIALGHEVTGVVDVCPPGSPFRPGDRVVVLAFKGCGQCRYCLAGRENLCEFTQHLGHGAGWQGRDYCPGGMAEYCTVWADKVYRLPDSVSFEEGVFLDGAAVALHALRRGNLHPGDRLLINGAGPIGLLALQIARHQGASNIICADIDSKPLELAKKMGADEALLVSAHAPQACYKGFEKADVIVDSTGDTSIFTNLDKLLARGGTLVLLAVKDMVISLNEMQLAGERTITVSANNEYADFPAAIDLMANGALVVKPLISHVFPLSRVKEGFDVMMDKHACSGLKVLILP